ncbi:MAG TPA: DUF58 domain-containing protein [Gemmatales bacterium]|nr:DUF58 domain-containing protein [Gemmatales bacterium]
MRWVVAAGLLFLLALALQLGLLVFAAYVLIGVLGVSWLLARSWTQHLYAERRLVDQSAEINDALDVAVVIRNTGPLPIPWVVAEDYLPPAALRQRPPRLRVEGKRLRVMLVWGRSSTRLRYTLVMLMRGFYQVGPVILEGGDLFGLYRRFRVETHPHFLLVYPRLVPLLGYDLSSRRPVGEIRLTHRLFEDPTRIAGVREYQQGDPLNRVHWKATARTGVLHCKIYEPSTIAGGTILLDFRREAYPTRGEPYRSELGITLAAALANTLYEMGQQFGLVTNARDAADRLRAEGWQVHAGAFSDAAHNRRAALAQAETPEAADRLQPVVVPTRRGPEQFELLRETLARLELNDGLTLAELVGEAGSSLPGDATVLAILAEAPPETALALGNLRRRGYAVTVFLLILDEQAGTLDWGRLLAEGLDVRHVPSEEAISGVCQAMALR